MPRVLSMFLSLRINIDPDKKEIYIDAYIIKKNPFSKVRTHSDFPLLFDTKTLKQGNYNFLVWDGNAYISICNVSVAHDVQGLE